MKAWVAPLVGLVLAACVAITTSPSQVPPAGTATVAPSTAVIDETAEPTASPEPTPIPFEVTVVNNSSVALLADVTSDAAGACYGLEPGQRVTMSIGLRNPTNGFGIEVTQLTASGYGKSTDMTFPTPGPSEIVITDGPSRGSIALSTKLGPTAPFPIPSNNLYCQGG